MKQKTLDELIEIIENNEHPDREAAIKELLTRVKITSKGGDRPPPPPPNP